MTLQVWDIGGQQLGGNMLETYLYGAHVCLHKLGLFIFSNLYVLFLFTPMAVEAIVLEGVGFNTS